MEAAQDQPRAHVRPFRKLIVFHFLLFTALSLVAVAAPILIIIFFFTVFLIPLGFLTIVAPTVLLYSLATLPLYFAVTGKRRRWQVIAFTAIIPILAATLPGLTSRLAAWRYYKTASGDDVIRPSATKPKTIELNGDLQSGMFPYLIGKGAPTAVCNNVCRRLLYNDEVERVRMTERLGGKVYTATYRHIHQDVCPPLFPQSVPIEPEVRSRLLAGDCLITDDTSFTPDASVTLTTRYSNQAYPPKLPDGAPWTATIVTVKHLIISGTRDGTTAQLSKKTEVKAQTLALPFSFHTRLDMQSAANNYTAASRDDRVMGLIDVAQSLRDVFGYKMDNVTAPELESPEVIAMRILARSPEADPVFSAQQLDAFNDVLAGLSKTRPLSASDVDLIKRIIVDRRINDAKIGVTLQNLLRARTAQLEPLIPVVLDRIVTPVDQSVGNYQSALGWALTNFSAASLRPFRDKMVAVVAAQDDWPSNGVLALLGEVGGDAAIQLVIQRLNSKKQAAYAALAICRAAPDVWPTFKPVALAHLTPLQKRLTIREDQTALLLALVRFGDKPVAIDILRQSGFDTTHAVQVLDKLQPGFGPEHCRDFL